MFETIEIKHVKQSIGALIKSTRKKRKLSRDSLATSLDISTKTIQNLESGKNFTIDNLLKILKEFDLLEDLNKEILEAKENLTNVKSLY